MSIVLRRRTYSYYERDPITSPIVSSGMERGSGGLFLMLNRRRHWFLPVLPDDIYLYLSVPVRQGQSELRRPWLAAEDLRDELIEEEAIQCRLSPFLAEVHLSY